ncbi:23S rRNA (uracil(1939)-C(5))-methyltransferase RlmD, partial [Klebsiella oxytoca]
SAYDENTGTGLVRHILIRKGFASGEIMVCLVINAKKAFQFFPDQDALLEKLMAIEGMTSVSVSLNPEQTNV